MKDKDTAGILALFLGGLGVHRFYLGEPGIGLIYLFFCWTFIPVIIAIIDALMFFTMKPDYFNSKYNREYLLRKRRIEADRASESSTSTTSVADEIQKLFDLKERGIITQDEFEAKKSRLLSK